MKKLFFISLILLVVFSCKNQKENTIFLFNNTSFELIPNETSSNVTEIEKDKFFSFFNEQAPNIPIYKHIKSHTHMIYIALPYNTSIQDLSRTQLITCDRDSLVQESDPTYFYNQYECTGEYVSEYVAALNGNIIYLLATTPSKEVADSLFSFTTMRSRFILK